MPPTLITTYSRVHLFFRGKLWFWTILIFLAVLALVTPVRELPVVTIRRFMTLLLIFILPGYVIVRTLLTAEREPFTRFSLSLTASTTITASIFLAASIPALKPEPSILLLSLITIITIVAAISFLSSLFKKSSEIALSAKRSSYAIMPWLKEYSWILAILLLTITIRVFSWQVGNRDSFTRDADMWFVYALEDGKLLEGYTSIWHYLGLSTYSYPILFSALVTMTKTLIEFSASQSFWLTIPLSIIPVSFTYVIARQTYGRTAAILSAFALTTTPIYIFETLPGTFKARALCYAFIAAELYCAFRILERATSNRKGHVILFLLFGSASIFTYRASLPINLLVIAFLTSSLPIMRRRTILRLFSIAIAVVGSILFAFAYSTYTPSFGLLETFASSLAKQGPILLLGIIGAIYALRRGRPTDSFIATPSLIILAVALVNWKAADILPLLLAPLSGLGIVQTRIPLGRQLKMKAGINWKAVALILLTVGILTTSFSLTYYPQRWYLKGESKLFDEIEEIRNFLADQPHQRGAVTYGTSYTGMSILGARSSILFIGPEQSTFVKAYVLNHLAMSDFDPRIMEHPESIYESTLQLQYSLYSLTGETLGRMLKTYFIQYLVIENDASLQKWEQTNAHYIKRIYSTDHYSVYHVTETESEIEMLHIVETQVPEDARLASPYYLSPFLSELRQNYIRDQLEATLNFNYIHLLQRISGAKRGIETLNELESKVKNLKEAYSDAVKLISFALKNKLTHIVTDSSQMRLELLSLGSALIFLSGNLSIFEVSKREFGQDASKLVKPEPFTLTVNIFEADSFDVNRYALTGPANDISIEISSEQMPSELGRTNEAGSASFQLQPGTYAIEARAGELSATLYVIVDHDTFLPIILHRWRIDPMRNLWAPYIGAISLLAAASSYKMLFRASKEIED